MVTFGIQQTRLEHAAVCSGLLKNTSNPNNQRTLECLRELWKALAVEAWRFEEAELAEEVEALSDLQAKILAEIRQTLH